MHNIETMEEIEELFLLPTTPESLDEFVAAISKQYELPNTENTYDTIATMILHLPQTKVLMPKSYFGHGVLKAIANRVAYDKLQIFRENREAQAKKQQEETQAAGLSLVPAEVSPVVPEPFQNA